MNFDDVFDDTATEEATTKIISENDYINEQSRIASSSYNESYLSEIEKDYPALYNDGFSKGKSYSLSFGKLFGLIEAITFLNETNFNGVQLTDKAKQELQVIKEELECYSEKVTDDFISSYKARLTAIINNYYN